MNVNISYRELMERGKKLGYLTPCYDSRNSFYRKATVYEMDGVLQLMSYDTIVAQLELNGDTANYVLYGYYSYTTNRHIKEFLRQFNIDTPPKKELVNICPLWQEYSKTDASYLGKTYMDFLTLSRCRK